MGIKTYEAGNVMRGQWACVPNSSASRTAVCDRTPRKDLVQGSVLSLISNENAHVIRELSVFVYDCYMQRFEMLRK